MDEGALIRLMAWLSPAFPVGGFAWSGGLEQAVADGMPRDAESLGDWLETLLTLGSLRNDAILLAAAHRAPPEAGAVAELAAALAGSAERHQETTALGEAFLLAAVPVWPQLAEAGLPPATPYPVAVGAAAGAEGVPLKAALAAFLHAAVAQTVSAGIRLGLCGQRDGVALLARLEPAVLAAAAAAADSTLDDLGTATLIADMATARHETLATRLFRS